jgi:hypothetical protein
MVGISKTEVGDSPDLLLELSGLGEVLDAAGVATVPDRGFRGMAKLNEHWHALVGLLYRGPGRLPGRWRAGLPGPLAPSRPHMKSITETLITTIGRSQRLGWSVASLPAAAGGGSRDG